MKAIVRNTIVLTLITLCAGILLGLAYEVTKEPIARQRQNTKENAYKAVFAEAESFVEAETGHLEDADNILAEHGYGSVVMEEIWSAMAGSEKLGYVMSITTKEGYGGDIGFSVGISLDGTVNGIEVLSISETAGLGMEAAEEGFKGQFAGVNTEAFTYTKNGAAAEDEIDVISGATITTKAMTEGVNAALLYFRELEADYE